MNILFAASELTPYAKTGGLGDVLAALPVALREKGHSISVVLPLYRHLKEALPGLQRTELALKVQLGDWEISAVIWQSVTSDGVTLFAVERDEFFDRSFLYGTADGDYFDNAARFIFFNKVVIALAGYLEPRPEVIHANDWQTALIPVLVQEKALPYRTVLTIHNLAYQGVFPARDFSLTNLPGFYFKPHMLEYYGQMNLLKAGIAQADMVTTVSPGYAREILMEQYGCGLHGMLATRPKGVVGILNGIDDRLWNPEQDSLIAVKYGVKNLALKRQNKEALLKQCGLPVSQKPLFGIITRLVEQKGVDLLLVVLPEILKTGVGLIVLGSGDSKYEQGFKDLAEQFPQQVAMQIGFDEKLAHQIEAGCDIFLMPSRFEPCGLNQFYSMRYGTIPIVHDIGGLSDSVSDEQTGFKFSEYHAESLQKTILRALAVFENKSQWQILQSNGMSQDYSWRQRVPEYERIYTELIK